MFLFLFCFLCRVSPGFLVPRVSLGFQDSQELRWVTSACHSDVVYHSVGGIFCSEWHTEYYEPVMMRRKHFDWWLSHPISAIVGEIANSFEFLFSLPFIIASPSRWLNLCCFKMSLGSGQNEIILCRYLWVLTLSHCGASGDNPDMQELLLVLCPFASGCLQCADNWDILAFRCPLAYLCCLIKCQAERS